MKTLILIGGLLLLGSLGMFAIYAFSLDHSLMAEEGKKPLVPALPLLGPSLMGLSLVILGTCGFFKKRSEA